MIEAFRAEIIEAEKSRTDLLKWKLVIVAALSAVGLGIGSETKSATISTNLALALIPLAATYVDLLCVHLQLRIHAIGTYFHYLDLKTTDNQISCFISYERFCGRVRSVFKLEDWAQVFSTIVISGLLIIAPLYMELQVTERGVLVASGVIGLVCSLLIGYSFRMNQRRIEDVSKKLRTEAKRLLVPEVMGVIVLNNRHLLDFLANRYTKDSLRALVTFLEDKGTLAFRPLPTHLFPAAELDKKSQYTGYRHVWVRDNVHVAHVHFAVGQYDVAKNVAGSLMRYFQKYQQRFKDIIHDPQCANTVMARPHMRFDGENLAEVAEKWSHAQNDALGYFLWFYCQLINNSLITPNVEDCRVLALFPLYFHAIQYWQDADSGHWEEERKVQASSIGAVKAGLDALLQVTAHFPDIRRLLIYKNDSIPLDLIASLAEQGESALADILPYECRSPHSKLRRYDAALLFLIYPLEVVDEGMADQIIQDVTQHLQGDYGIRRYIGDSFWAPDYKTKLPPEERTIDVSDDMSSRNSLVIEGQEAQWCIFDSILSTIFGKKFGRTGQEEYLEKQTLYFNRALGQLTGADCPAGEFLCPELYYLEGGKYTPNDSTPLLWAQANLKLALHQMQVSLDEYSGSVNARD